MPSTKRPHNDVYADKRDALKRKVARNPERYPCWICRQPIDTTLDWKHPMSFTYDHNVAIANGGDPRGEGKPAHRACNSRRGHREDAFEVIEVSNRSMDWLQGPTG